VARLLRKESQETCDGPVIAVVLVRRNRESNTRPPNLRIAISNSFLGLVMQAWSCSWLAGEAGVLRPLDPLAFSQISLFFEIQRFVEVYVSILLSFSNAQVLVSKQAKESLGFRPRLLRISRRLI
jgi:hypothetical protein